MNTDILLPEVQAFINAHLKTALPTLILKGSPFDTVSIQELATQIQSKQKSQEKLPSWSTTTNIYYPPKVHIEQTSSELTAAYKASLVSGNTLIDLTGGFGVDSYYFAQKFQKIIHCEVNSQLSKIVAHNYQQLNKDTIETHAIDGVHFLKHTKESIDVIYCDPSRRDDANTKVFLVEDCTPNIIAHIDFFLEKANTVLIKLSPMLDLSLAIEALKHVSEVHIVALHNDVKELLFLLTKENTPTVGITCINLKKKTQEQFSFAYRSNTAQASYSLPKKYLYEPNAAIMKSGGFTEVAVQLGLDKLHQHSHLYTSDALIDFPGRVFEIEAIHPYDRKKLKKRFQKANITARNFPKSVAQIRKETQIKDGGIHYLFATTTLDQQRIVLECRKLIS